MSRVCIGWARRWQDIGNRWCSQRNVDESVHSCCKTSCAEPEDQQWTSIDASRAEGDEEEQNGASRRGDQRRLAKSGCGWRVRFRVSI